MTCALDAPRGADLQLSYTFPTGTDFSGWDASWIIYDEKGGTAQLSLSTVATANGSEISFLDNVITVLITSDDIDDLPVATDTEEPSLLWFDFILENTASLKTKIQGGLFRVLPYGYPRSQISDQITVELDDITYQVQLVEGPSIDLNVTFATQAQAVAGTANNVVMSPERTTQHFDAHNVITPDVTGGVSVGVPAYINRLGWVIDSFPGSTDTDKIQAAVSDEAIFKVNREAILEEQIITTGVNVRIQAGPGAKLKWPSSAASAGLKFTFTDPESQICQIGDIEYVTDLEGGYTALDVRWPDSGTGYRSLLDCGRMTVKGGSVGGQVGYWDKGLYAENAWLPEVRFLDFRGKNSGGTRLSENALHLKGHCTDGTIKVRSQSTQTAILIEGFSEGMHFNGSTLIATGVGFDTTGMVNAPSLFFDDVHIAADDVGFRAAGLLQVHLRNLLIYKNTDSSSDFIGVDIGAGCDDWNGGNIMVFSLGNPGGGTTTAMRIGGSSIDLRDNRFAGCDVDVETVAGQAAGSYISFTRTDGNSGVIINGEDEAVVVCNPEGALGGTTQGFTVLDDESATPDILGGIWDYFYFNYSTAVPVTDFLNGYLGQQINVQFANDNVTIVHGSSISTPDGQNISCASGNVITLCKTTLTGWTVTNISGQPQITDYSAGGDLPASPVDNRIAIIQETITDARSLGISLDGKWQRHIVKNYIEQYGGSGGSGASASANTAAFAAAFADGCVVELMDHGVYPVSESIIPMNNTGIVGSGSPNKGRIYMPAANFSNTSQNSGDRYATNAVGINASGLTTGPYTAKHDLVFEGFGIESQVSAGRILRALTVRNVNNMRISGIEIFGLPTAMGLCLASLTGQLTAEDCYIHDFADSTNWAALPQSTAIEVDNDIINSVGTNGLVIRNNHIADITVSGSLLSTWGYQTDGVNIISPVAYGNKVIDNYITGVGEGADVFGSRTLISNNVIKDCYIYGVKITHGGQQNVIANNSIRRIGLAGITIDSSSQNQDVQRNAITGNVIAEIDHDGVWSASDSACIRFNGVGVTYKCKDNIGTGNHMSTSANGKYGWLDISDGSGNYGEGNHIIAGASCVRRVLVNVAGGTCRVAGSGTYSTNLV